MKLLTSLVGASLFWAGLLLPAYGMDVRPGALTAAHLQDGAVTTAKLADGSVTTPKLHSEALVDANKDAAFARIAVGKAVASYLIDVLGVTGQGALLGLINTATDAQMDLGESGTSLARFTWARTTDALSISAFSSGNESTKLSIKGGTGGGVGVGTASPCSTCTLHVAGNISAQTDIRADNGFVQAGTSILFDNGVIGMRDSGSNTVTWDGGSSHPSGYKFTTAALGIDVVGINNSGHITSSGTAPTVSSCGTSPTIVGSDAAGKVTVGSSASGTCTVTFDAEFAHAPACILTNEDADVPVGATTTTTALTITDGAGDFSSDVIMYVCFGQDGG